MIIVNTVIILIILIVLISLIILIILIISENLTMYDSLTHLQFEIKRC